jgi:hypothetical protein
VEPVDSLDADQPPDACCWSAGCEGGADHVVSPVMRARPCPERCLVVVSLRLCSVAYVADATDNGRQVQLRRPLPDHHLMALLNRRIRIRGLGFFDEPPRDRAGSEGHRAAFSDPRPIPLGNSDRFDQLSAGRRPSWPPSLRNLSRGRKIGL